jgi:hypothetical protein
MKAICIRDTTFALRNGVYDRASKVMGLTIGREYEVEDIYPDCYFIKTENRYSKYPKAFFITLEEYRNQKLEELGI